MTDKSKIMRIARFTFSAFALALMAYFLWQNANTFEKIKKISVTHFGILAFLNFMNLILLTVIQRITITPYINPPSNFFLFRLVSAGQFSNFIFPSKLGMWLPGLYLKMKSNLDYKLFTYGVIYQALIAIIVMVFFSGNMYLYLNKYFFYNGLFSLLFGVFTFLLYKRFGLPRSVKQLHLKTKSYNLLLTNRVFILIFMAHTGILVIYIARVYFSLSFFGLEVIFISCATACFMTLVIGSIPFLPGIIGIRETTIASALLFSGYNSGDVTAALLIERMAQILINAPFAFATYIDDTKK